MLARRRAVSCSMVCLLVRASSCFGYISRDSGHSRVPAPPERITGITKTHDSLTESFPRPIA